MARGPHRLVPASPDLKPNVEGTRPLRRRTSRRREAEPAAGARGHGGLSSQARQRWRGRGGAGRAGRDASPLRRRARLGPKGAAASSVGATDNGGGRSGSGKGRQSHGVVGPPSLWRGGGAFIPAAAAAAAAGAAADRPSAKTAASCGAPLPGLVSHSRWPESGADPLRGGRYRGLRVRRPALEPPSPLRPRQGKPKPLS